jgi:hypothetical protein
VNTTWKYSTGGALRSAPAVRFSQGIPKKLVVCIRGKDNLAAVAALT